MDVVRIHQLLDAHDAGGLTLVDSEGQALALDEDPRALVRELLRLAHLGACAELARAWPPHNQQILQDLFRRHQSRWPKVTP